MATLPIAEKQVYIASHDERKLVDCGENIPWLACAVLRFAIGS
jgi:hypothetical protein